MMNKKEKTDEELIIKLREGDRSSGDLLVRKMEPIVERIINRYGDNPFREILRSAAYEGLVKAIENYDKEKSSFKTYAKQKIRGYIFDEWRVIQKRGFTNVSRGKTPEVIYSEQLTPDDPSPTLSLPVEETTRTEVEKKGLRDLLLMEIKSVPGVGHKRNSDRNRKMALLKANGATLKQIAEVFDFSPQNADQILKRFFRELKKSQKLLDYYEDLE